MPPSQDEDEAGSLDVEDKPRALSNIPDLPGDLPSDLPGDLPSGLDAGQADSQDQEVSTDVWQDYCSIWSEKYVHSKGNKEIHDEITVNLLKTNW